MVHVPVLPKQVLEYLNPKANENFIDATIGEGGHSIGILEKNKPNGKVLGIEIDSEQIKNCGKRLKKFKDRIILVNDSYTNLKEIVEKNNFGSINGILFDLGMSSWHLEESGRGFSFLRDEPLIMRYARNQTQSLKLKTGLNSEILTAEIIINQWPEKKLAKIFKEYGEERYARRIAQGIVQNREIQPIKTTGQLVEIIRKAVPSGCQHRRIHFATRAFQALRIAVNDELNNFEKVLPQSMEILGKGGRMVIISFHSLEDRIAKNFLKAESKKGLLKILTKKPITAGSEEIKSNPRARSAKLRAAVIRS